MPLSRSSFDILVNLLIERGGHILLLDALIDLQSLSLLVLALKELASLEEGEGSHREVDTTVCATVGHLSSLLQRLDSLVGLVIVDIDVGQGYLRLGTDDLVVARTELLCILQSLLPVGLLKMGIAKRRVP